MRTEDIIEFMGRFGKEVDWSKGDVSLDYLIKMQDWQEEGYMEKSFRIYKLTQKAIDKLTKE